MDEKNLLMKFANAVFYVIDTPVTFFRKNIVEPNQKQYPWYHQKFRRVPTIDECYTDDITCYYEANCQFERDKLVDDQIIAILRHRYEECVVAQKEEGFVVCEPLHQAYKDASAAWFTKYGDLGGTNNVIRAYMKQKHRLIWERRHGAVGTGMKESVNAA